jgi:general secretion pathway protein E
MEHRLPAGTPGEADGVPLPWGRLHFEQIAAALTADGLVAEQDRERMRFSAGRAQRQ